MRIHRNQQKRVNDPRMGPGTHHARQICSWCVLFIVRLHLTLTGVSFHNECKLRLQQHVLAEALN